MGYDRFDGNDESHDKNERHEVFLREMVEMVTRSNPGEYNRFLRSMAIGKLRDTFNDSEFCVLSGFRERVTKEDNLLRQYILIEEIKGQGLWFIPHTGFWDNLNHRCLFVPYMKKEQALALCREYELSYYVHGIDGLWSFYSTGNDTALARSTTLKYIGFDEPFMMYYKIMRTKHVMCKEIADLVTKRRRLTAEQKKRIQVITRQIEDLEKLEREVIERQL